MQLRMVKLLVTEISKQNLDSNMKMCIIQFSSHSTSQLQESSMTVRAKWNTWNILTTHENWSVWVTNQNTKFHIWQHHKCYYKSIVYTKPKTRVSPLISSSTSLWPLLWRQAESVGAVGALGKRPCNITPCVTICAQVELCMPVSEAVQTARESLPANCWWLEVPNSVLACVPFTVKKEGK